MLNVFECGAVVPGCRFVAHDDDREDLMVTAIQHLHTVHEIDHLSEAMKARLRAVIKEATAEPG